MSFADLTNLRWLDVKNKCVVSVLENVTLALALGIKCSCHQMLWASLSQIPTIRRTKQLPRGYQRSDTLLGNRSPLGAVASRTDGREET